MGSSVGKRTWRAIKAFPGRYLAILLIVMLSVGFFAGLKVTRDAMVNTADEYLSEQNFYDFKLLSTLGFTDEDVEHFANLDGIETAQGDRYVDALVEIGGTPCPVRLYSLPEGSAQQIDIPSPVAGRMPSAAGEILADKKIFDEEDIGTVLHLSPENGEGITDRLNTEQYIIVGIVDSPLHIGIDRGTTDIGSGTLYTYLYLPAEHFTDEVYTDIALTLAEDADLYSEEYDALVAKYKETVTEACRERAQLRYESLLDEVREALTEQMSAIMPGLEPDEETVLETAEDNGITEPQTYVLTRDENAGYVSFENDSAIVSGIANIFPIFFILIAMLVCITTMTRMVDEERTQIGVLKAMGVSHGGIMTKYLLYAGSATVIGWGIGFFLGTLGLPQVFWFAYNALYDFAPLSYLFSPSLAILTLAAALVGILGSTFLSCRRELADVPAALIRPRAAKVGKRILLERITPLWRKLPFLQKITLRNMFLYKRRLVMMLLGISCCAGLVVTAFGVRDSMIDIGSLQYENIQTYDLEVSFNTDDRDALTEGLDGMGQVEDYLLCTSDRVELLGDDTAMNAVTMLGLDEVGQISDFWHFTNGDEVIAFPAHGETIVSRKVADKLSLKAGDALTVRNADMNTFTVTVSGVFDNYINNYIVLSAETYADAEGLGAWEPDTALLSLIEGMDEEGVAHELTAISAVTGVSRLSVTRENVDSALSCLDYIIWMVVLFSGALAFIVIFNLTNINLAERSREIATVQVLGFYPRETNSYVLRENLVLSAVAAVIGLPLGTVFHHVVMSMILIDSFTFNMQITALSYVMSLICTILFAVLVNLFMRRQVAKIKMAESLKAVE